MGTNPNQIPNQIAGALTYPSGSSNPTPQPQQPRQPRDLQSLLRFAMEATAAEGAPGNSNFGPMDEERKKFLEEALKSMTINITEVIQEALKVLTDQEKIRALPKDGPLPQEIETAFDNILEFICDIDVANDFYKLGGFAMFPIAYNCPNEKFKARASTVVGELVQNNPYCQEKLLLTGLLNVICRLLQTEKGDSLTKCIFAVSSATRGYPEGIQALKREDGFATLVKILKSHDPFPKAKAAFVIGELCREDSDAREQFIQHDIIKTIAADIKRDRDRATEHMLKILLTLTEHMTPTVLEQFLDPELNLREILESHLRHPDFLICSCQDEKACSQELIKRLFIDTPKVIVHEEAADR